ncbi:hypothetical protein MVEN_02016600 [Mycena venus]|uniref:Uncharacterized protein n=1 Tax=Mycena venus TaxID=2733690 RepID=A0A8H7CJS7_9AGAR|nr:hypothetical protein MVEN_02016600 [Mycena venus]
MEPIQHSLSSTDTPDTDQGPQRVSRRLQAMGNPFCQKRFRPLDRRRGPKFSSSSSFPKSQHKGQYDATLLTETEFREQIEGGSLIETLCCLIPGSEECVIMDNTEVHARRGSIGKSHLQTMRIWVEERRQKDLEKAMKFWAKGGEMREKGWKILQHPIAAERILQGLQRIVDDEKIDLRNVTLTQETLQRLVANGQEDDDRAWLALDWKDVQRAHKTRLERIKGP